MKTLRRLIYGEVLTAVAFVTLGFLGLFFFFDIVEELSNIGKQGYTLHHALFYSALLIPNHLYELLPITTLIGSVFVMARLAQSNEYTILRTSGLGPGRALRALAGLGLVFVALTFLVGDYAAPASEQTAQNIKNRLGLQGGESASGAWLKERQKQSAYVVHIAGLNRDGGMQNLRIFEFDNAGRLASFIQAQTGQFASVNGWQLQSVRRSTFPANHAEQAPQIQHEQFDQLPWPTEITAEMVSVALLKPDQMSTIDLWRYSAHLSANGQSAQRFEIEFWRKVFYPFSCIVMTILALPFAYLHLRSGSITGYVFTGVMVGISFFLLNNVLGYIGTLRQWEPWLAAATPGMVYLAFSLLAFVRLVRRS